ncbi:hypothetical protein [Enhygromyxa salina]|uniref:Uncharacterized protein n=1 Tax=Enhygromyxa salina TaxID=215803 RepID=A0A2S9YML2_9BACT|nr:hypothetical protein [Enhygromyxa salina]PRQ06329.1 hypothetical protein ENSA7_40060 [Enhygromyxa salina]
MQLPDPSELGLVGGVIAVIVGVLAAVFVYTISGNGTLWIGGAFLSAGLIFTGSLAIAKARSERLPEVAALPDEYLEIKLVEAALPFGVCVRCRQIDEPAAFHGRCPRCDAGADYVVVELDAERQLARSSLGITQ